MRRFLFSLSGLFSGPVLAPVVAVVALLALTGCNRKASGPGARIYHSTTSLFNGYYNAERLLDATTLELENRYQIPDVGFVQVHYYGNPADIKAIDGDLGKVIEKNDILIYKHFNGSFEDDCRILTGQAWFYRQNYSLALQNFNYILDNFPRSPHAPHAKLWICRTYLAMGNREGARSALEEELLSQRDLVLDDEMRAEIAIFQSQLLIEDGKLRRATDELEKGLSYIHRRREQTKAHLLLGQLYAARDSFVRAKQEFDWVAKKSDRYDIAFRARLLSARMTVAGQPDAVDQMERILRKMIKDEKNNDYKDQLYYELALISLSRKQTQDALTLLNASIKVNTQNKRQKGLSYYKAGQIYFDSYKNYPKAEAYYDSAATTINKDAPEYEEITRINAVLRDYVKCVSTIQREDSLQRLALMPREELDLYIDKLIKEEEARKKAAEAEAAAQLARMASAPTAGAQASSSGKWYFDDPQLVASGKTQFTMQWGARKDEDNWRRSKKSATLVDNTPVAAPVDSTLTKEFGDKAKYYQPIPFTAEARKTSDGAIEKALYDLGQIYSLRLQNKDSAIAVLERLLGRFPETERAASAHYTLYSQKLPDSLRAKPHRDWILKNEPNSVYAMLMLGKDPVLAQQELHSFRAAYSGLYDLYEHKQYATAVGFSGYILENFKEQGEINFSEVLFIRGMCYGYAGMKDSLRTILTKVITKYPKAEITPKAKKILEGMAPAKPAQNLATPQPAAATAGATKTDSGDPKDPANPAYNGFKQSITAGDKLIVLFFIDVKNIGKNEIQTKLADFNSANFKGKDLKTYVFSYGSTHWVPYVSTFNTEEEAKAYMNAIQESSVARELMRTSADRVVYMTQENFKLAYGKKRMQDYLLLFDNIINVK